MDNNSQSCLLFRPQPSACQTHDTRGKYTSKTSLHQDKYVHLLYLRLAYLVMTRMPLAAV